ncbi:MAG: glycosyltransferase family 2 protein, partial [Bacteroidales bacterium]|nr:glycosyltransferase family 2 protein [Bacteroidales bacterium]
MLKNSGTPPLFSVIVNVYNPGSLVADCLHSVFMQNLPQEDFEVIIVDDCSTDGSIDYIDELTKGYGNTTTLRHTRTKGRGGAYNTGMRSARGQCIVFMDSYDYWQYSDTLSKLRKSVMDTGADIIVNT